MISGCYKGLRSTGRRATIALVFAGFPELVDTDECRKASPVAVWHSSLFHAPRGRLRRARASEADAR